MIARAFLLIAIFLSVPALGFSLEPTRVDGSPLGPVHYYAPPTGRRIDGLVIVISVVLQTIIERKIRRQSVTGR